MCKQQRPVCLHDGGLNGQLITDNELEQRTAVAVSHQKGSIELFSQTLPKEKESRARNPGSYQRTALSSIPRQQSQTHDDEILMRDNPTRGLYTVRTNNILEAETARWPNQP